MNILFIHNSEFSLPDVHQLPKHQKDAENRMRISHLWLQFQLYPSTSHEVAKLMPLEPFHIHFRHGSFVSLSFFFSISCSLPIFTTSSAMKCVSKLLLLHRLSGPRVHYHHHCHKEAEKKKVSHKSENAIKTNSE